MGNAPANDSSSARPSALAQLAGPTNPTRKPCRAPRVAILTAALLLLSIEHATGEWRPGGPAPRTVVSGAFLFIGEDEFVQADAVAAQLAELGREVEQTLGLPGLSSPVHIHVFPSFRSYQAYLRTRFPEFGRAIGSRRSLFVLQDGTPSLFVVDTGQIMRDLRHEFVHALLNTQVRGLPMWLDEGLAEYFEVEGPARGQPEYVALLRRRIDRGWSSELARLERLTDFRQMDALAYAEAWSWVEFLLNGTPVGPALLRQYLIELAAGPPRGTIAEQLARLVGDPSQSWAAHVRRWSSRSKAAATAPTR